MIKSVHEKSIIDDLVSLKHGDLPLASPENMVISWGPILIF